MKAFFADIRETGLVPDRGRGRVGREAVAAHREQKQRLAELDDEITALRRGLDAQAKATRSSSAGPGKIDCCRISRPANWPGSISARYRRIRRQRREAHHL